ncbi:MAG: arginyltransferase [Proteobacteria bacterium]|nr:arginyltransferase [Pseudomonadota bacterium]MDE3208234.1 arginyltransferase [Pseudomonadota bacterium]
MANLLNEVPRNLQFYITTPYPCSYLTEKQARSQVATPSHLISSDVYSNLVQLGFRRSGIYIYRPQCDRCHACVPVRIVVDALKLSRSQRRTLRRNNHLRAYMRELDFQEEHYDLYRRYQVARHPGGGMDQDNVEQYCQFLLQSGIDTKLVEFCDATAVRIVSIIDEIEDGLSSVYTFYDPDPLLASASYGTYNILWQAQLCQELGLSYLYLGYWIHESSKMNYKINFQPLEGFINGSWQPLTPDMIQKLDFSGV